MPTKSRRARSSAFSPMIRRPPISLEPKRKKKRGLLVVVLPLAALGLYFGLGREEAGEEKPPAARKEREATAAEVPIFAPRKEVARRRAKGSVALRAPSSVVIQGEGGA